MRRPLLVISVLAPLVSTLAVADRPAREVAPAALAQVLRGRPRSPLADERGRVPMTVRLLPGESAAALGLLEVAPGVGARWVEPGEMDDFLETNRARRPWASPPLRLLNDVSGTQWTRARAAHKKTRNGQPCKGKGVAVGVIDTGIDATHPDLREANKGPTRVAWMLDLANKPLGLHPELEEKFGCTQRPQAPCAVLSGEDIDALLSGKIEGAVPPSDFVGHGTHVASIAAGNGNSSKAKTYAGVAPEATLIAVRVTRSAGGESVTDSDLLNAVRFFFDRADSMGLPGVVNVSLGGDYGPHDGTSTLEEGLAAFVGPDKPGRAIVLAAGNSGGILTDDDGQTYGVHTEARSLAGATTRVQMRMPAATSDARGSAFVWVTFQPGDDVKVGLELGDKVVGPFGRGSQGAIDEGDANPYMAVINGVVGGESPLSARTNGAVIVADGTFRPGDRLKITLEGDGTAQLWVQGLGAAEFGSSTGGMLFLNPLKQGTVNVPATHPSLLSVGCTLNRLSWPTQAGSVVEIQQVGAVKAPEADSVCFFSGAGPNALGVLKPEIAAPGGFVSGAMSANARPDENPVSMFSDSSGRCGGVKTCFVTDEFHGVASGTSMSAPQVAGAVALLLQQNTKLTQPDITALLQAGSRRFAGRTPLEQQSPGVLDAQTGPGALDIDESLEILSPTVDRPPTAVDPKASWLHLSVAFARPDGRWPVVGTVALRDSEGRSTDGDGQPPALRLDNGSMLRPPSRVGRGLYRFEVAAPPGTGGELLTVRVQLGAAALAERSLPIAPDIWNVNGMPEARGGCSLAR